MSMTSPFHSLTAPVRRALARAELRRRGKPEQPEPPDRLDEILVYASWAALERAEVKIVSCQAEDGENCADCRGAMAEMLQDARARMLLSRLPADQQPAPPGPMQWPERRLSIEEHTALRGAHQETVRDHQSLVTAGPAPDDLLAEVDRLLAEGAT